MNVLPRKTQLEIKALLMSGNSIRAVADATGVSRVTVLRYAKSFCVRAACGCGQQAGHRGWCWYRFQFSPSRSGWMAARWGQRANNAITVHVQQAFVTARRLGHTTGRFVWGENWATANLAYTKCAVCGATGYLKADGHIEGRFVEDDCLTAEAKTRLRASAEEKRQWRHGKRTLGEVKKLLRSPSRSAASTPAPSSRP